MVVSALGMAMLPARISGTPAPFLNRAGQPIAGSVSEKIWVDINGVRQGMVIRGENLANPVLLWVHGRVMPVTSAS